MTRAIPALVALAAFAGTFAHAEEAKPDNAVSLNVAITSDYRYRGISQTRLKHAVQGGADYSHNPSGLYAGTWLSRIEWTGDAGGDGDIEWDVYGGKRGQRAANASYDVGILRYVYPSNRLNPNADTTELYLQLGYGPAYIKYSHSATNLFGITGSENSGYLDVGANLDTGRGLTFNLHLGHQSVKGQAAGTSNSRFSYSDWKVGVSRDFGVASAAVTLIGTNADKTAYASPVNGKFMGRTGFVISVSKAF